MVEMSKKSKVTTIISRQFSLSVLLRSLNQPQVALSGQGNTTEKFHIYQNIYTQVSSFLCKC